MSRRTKTVENIEMKTTIALFGGSFDPPHIGHVHVVLTLLEKKIADEVWVVPSFRNPFKKGIPTSATIRRAMVDASFRDLPSTKCVYDELEGNVPLYSIESVKLLMERYPVLRSSTLYFVVGFDVFCQRKRWHDIESLEKLVTFVSVPRVLDGPEEPLSEWPSQAVWVDMPRLDVSSSAIRDRIRQGLYVDHLLNPKVHHLITTHELYRDQERESKAKRI